jgi:hypothetical protein
MTRAHWISTGVIAALAATAALGQAQRQAAPGPIAVTERAGDPARAALPSVERLFDGYVRDNKMEKSATSRGGRSPTPIRCGGSIR